MFGVLFELQPEELQWFSFMNIPHGLIHHHHHYVMSNVLKQIKGENTRDALQYFTWCQIPSLDLMEENAFRCFNPSMEVALYAMRIKYTAW